MKCVNKKSHHSHREKKIGLPEFNNALLIIGYLSLGLVPVLKQLSYFK